MTEIFYCLIRDGVVVNRTVADRPLVKEDPPGAFWVQNDEAQIGWTYEEDGTFIAPPRPPDPDPDPVPEQLPSPIEAALIEELAITKAAMQDLAMRLEKLEGARRPD